MGQGLRLIALTGVRVAELSGAEIKEFERLDDAKNATCNDLLVARSKNGKAHVVPLSELALSIVVDLLKRATGVGGRTFAFAICIRFPERSEEADRRSRILGSDDPIRKCIECCG